MQEVVLVMHCLCKVCPTEAETEYNWMKWHTQFDIFFFFLNWTNLQWCQQLYLLFSSDFSSAVTFLKLNPYCFVRIINIYGDLVSFLSNSRIHFVFDMGS